MPILAARSYAQRRPRRRVYGPLPPSNTAALTALSSLATKGLSGPSGKVPLSATSTTQAKASAGVFGGIVLSARSALRAMGQAGAWTGKAALSATSSAQTKTLSQPSGKVPLSGQASTAVKSLDSMGFGGLLSLFAISALQTKARAPIPTVKAALSALGSAQTKAQAGPAGKVPLQAKSALQTKLLDGLRFGIGLQARGTTQAKGKASAPTVHALLSALSQTSLRARGGLSGKMSLQARSALRTSAAAGSRAGQFISLFALASLRSWGAGALYAPIRQALTSFYQHYTADTGPNAPTSFFKGGNPGGGGNSSFFNKANTGDGNSASSSFYKE